MTIIAPHAPDADKLVGVIEEMKALGRPIIHAAWYQGTLLALEGSHRLAAAHALGMTPKVIVLGDDDVFDHDFQDVQNDVTVLELIEELCERYWDWEVSEYEF